MTVYIIIAIISWVIATSFLFYHEEPRTLTDETALSIIGMLIGSFWPVSICIAVIVIISKKLVKKIS